MTVDAQVRSKQVIGLVAVVGLQSFMISALGQFGLQGTALFLRDAGHSSDVVGLVFLASIPWILRFLFAPLVDRHGSRRLGHFRIWLLTCHALASILCAFFLLTDPSGSPYPLLVVGSLVSFVIGLQQLAVFGLIAVRLDAGHFPTAMAAQAAGYGAAGVVVGGAVVYLLADLGWTVTITALTALTAATLVPVLFSRLDKGLPTPAATATFTNHFALFKKREARRLLLLALLLETGMGSTYGLQSILLIDERFSVADAGLVSIVGASTATILGSLIARPLVERLGTYFTMAFAGALIGLVCVAYAAITYLGLSAWFTVGFILINSAAMMGIFVATRSLLLPICGEGRKATDSAAFAGLEGFAFLAITGISASVADYVPVPVIVGLTGLVSVAGAALTWRYARENMQTNIVGQAA